MLSRMLREGERAVKAGTARADWRPSIDVSATISEMNQKNPNGRRRT